MEHVDQSRDRCPWPGKSLREYIDRVIVGVRPREPRGLDVVVGSFEPSYVYAPYMPIVRRVMVTP